MNTITEQLLYSTIRIIAEDSVGTGFFFSFNINDKRIPIIVTNKHVVKSNPQQKVKFILHLVKIDEKSPNIIEFVYSPEEWIFHPEYDLCFCYFAAVEKTIKMQHNRDVLYCTLAEDLIASDERLKGLSVMEEVAMVGYPLGLWDAVNKLPIYRRGVTSTAPWIDFCGKSHGLVDMACFNGSSGSPIFIYNPFSYMENNNIQMGCPRLIFLGIQFETYCLNTEGKVVVKTDLLVDKLSVNTPILANLGVYVKAKEILFFKEIVKTKLEFIDNINRGKTNG